MLTGCLVDGLGWAEWRVPGGQLKQHLSKG